MRPTQASFIFCLDINSGSLVWQYTIPDAHVDPWRCKMAWWLYQGGHAGR